MIVRLRVLGLTLAAISLIACGADDDSPTGPGAELVGTWEVFSTDYIEVFAAGFEDVLVEEGVSRAQASAFADSVFQDAEDDFFGGLRDRIRFNVDGTYQDNSGNEGTWSIDGNNLVTVDEDGERDTVEFFLDGNELTLIFSVEYVIGELRADDDLTAEHLALTERALEGVEVIRIVYRRQ